MNTLRMPRHNIGPLDEWRESLEMVLRRQQVIQDREPLPSDGKDLLDCDLELLCLRSLFEDQRPLMDESAARGAGVAYAAAICQSHASGTVILREPGQPERRIPVGPAGLNPASWRDGLMLACIARNADASWVLSAPEIVEACQLPLERQDAFWLPYCQAFASLVADRSDVLVHAQAALSGMSEAQIAQPGVIDLLDRPLLELALALLGGSQSDWDDRLAQAMHAHHTYYEAEDRRFDRRGFVAVGIIGLCALAVERGLSVSVESDYLPSELIHGEQRPAPSRVVYEFEPRSLMRDDEARWFLDLAGFPRTTRSHEIVERDGALIARYEAHHAPGLANARMDFVLEAADGGAAPPLALDAGELLALARRFGTSAADTRLPPAERQALLAEAVSCVDSALARIPTGIDSIPAASIVSDLGRAELQAEPGRFSRARLEAYRDGLAAQLPVASAPGPKELVDAASEVIRARVAPILEALARDRTGDVARMLMPRPEDYERVFVGRAVEVARQGYANIWSRPIKMDYPSIDQQALLISVAPAGMLREDNELSRAFPGGYQAIARWLNPHRVWVRWKYVRRGETAGLAYDGLVWCDDHWAWFPKPYRVLAPALSSSARRAEPT